MEYSCRQVSDERYEIITERYERFQNSLEYGEPVKVFDALSKNLLDDLEVIREVSRELQKKKEEDVSKAAQAAEQQAEEDAKKAEEDAKKAEEEAAAQEKEAEKEDA